MRSRHLMSNTNYTKEWGTLFASVNMICQENSFEELAEFSDIYSLLVTAVQLATSGPLLLTWFNFNPSMDM